MQQLNVFVPYIIKQSAPKVTLLEHTKTTKLKTLTAWNLTIINAKLANQRKGT